MVSGAVELRVRAIYEAHAPVDQEQEGELSKLLVSPFCLGVVVISESLKRIFTDRYGISNKYLVAHDGAFQDVISGEKWPGEVRQGQFNVGYTGHLHKGRGIELILETAKDCPWADFHVVGGDPQQVRSYRKCLERQGTKNIFFHGFSPPALMPSFRSAMDVLIAPYQEKVMLKGDETNTAEWMSPLKIFEYMSSGKPLLCSDLPVLREIVQDGINGVLCSPGDPRDWAAKLKALHENPSRAFEIGQSAKDDFQNHYSWEKRAERILSKYVCGESE